MTKAREMLELADEIESRSEFLIATDCDKLIVEALRLAAQADAPAIQPQRMPESRFFIAIVKSVEVLRKTIPPT